MKKLFETRDELYRQIEQLNDKYAKRAADGEEVIITDEEKQELDGLTLRFNQVCDLIKSKSEARQRTFEGRPEQNAAAPDNGEEQGDDENGGEQDEKQERAALKRFLITGRGLERRADTNMTVAANASVMPKTIVQQVVQKLENICSIYEGSTKFHFKGTVSFPVISTDNDDCVVSYADEFATLESHVPEIKTVDLGGHLFGARMLVSLSLINNASIDVIDVIVNRLALSLKSFLEGENLNGTAGKMQGALTTENIVAAAAADVITADDLIDLQAAVIDAYQPGCRFIMHPETRSALRKLKDGQGRLIFINDATTGFQDMLFGKPVEVSDKMPKLGAGNKAVLYCDPSGLYTNIREDIGLAVLREKYIEHHAVGLQLWAEMDSKIVVPQKFAALACASA